MDCCNRIDWRCYLVAELSEARKRANKKWNDANKDKMKIYQYRSKARKFITEYASKDELQELQRLIKVRIKQLD